MTTATIVRHTFQAFGGSRCEILAAAAEDDVSDVVAEVYAFEAQLTRFDPRSELSLFNSAAGKTMPVTPLLEALLQAALDAYVLSDGLVNAAVHHALVRAGYDRTIAEVRRREPQPEAPPAAQPAEPVPPLPQVLTLGPGWARLVEGHAIDLGGIAKGWLADQLCDRFDNALINLGGDLHAHGDGPDGSGWTVAMCDGRAVTLREGGVATSGITGRRWRGGHHLIDPRTGTPASTDMAAVTVVADTAFRAEVLAKSAALLGVADAGPWLEASGAIRHAAVGAASIELDDA